MAGIFERLFKRTKEPAKTERAEFLSNSTAVFTPWSGDAYNNDIYRAAVDAIARNAAKLRRHNTVWTITPQGTAPAARYGVFLFYSPSQTLVALL